MEAINFDLAKRTVQSVIDELASTGAMTKKIERRMGYIMRFVEDAEKHEKVMDEIIEDLLDEVNGI